MSLALPACSKDTRFVAICQSVDEYIVATERLGLTDEQVASIPYKRTVLGTFIAFISIIWTFLAGLLIVPLYIPSYLVFFPLYHCAGYNRKKIAQKALKGSRVKIEGKDVVASAMVMRGLLAFPLLSICYTLLAAGLLIGFWPFTSPFDFPIWLIPIMVFFLFPLYAYISVLIHDWLVMHYDWLKRHRLVLWAGLTVMIRWPKTKVGAVRAQRLSLELVCRDYYREVMMEKYFADWKMDPIINLAQLSPLENGARVTVIQDPRPRTSRSKSMRNTLKDLFSKLRREEPDVEQGTAIQVFESEDDVLRQAEEEVPT